MRVSRIARASVMHRFVYGYRFHNDGLRLSWFLAPTLIGKSKCYGWSVEALI
jgi:hypothetical protein